MTTPSSSSPDTRVELADLSADQREVYDRVLSWENGSSPRRVLTLGGVAGSGKGQPLDALVMTPFGERPMGDLRVGSPVSNPDGSVASVIAVHLLGVRDLYRVHFSDGPSTLVTEDHLWFTHRAGKRLKAARRDADNRSVNGRVATTIELLEIVSRRGVSGRAYHPLVPLARPVRIVSGNNRSDRTLINPYVLGALLGDGSMIGPNVSLCSADREIVERVERELGIELRNAGLTFRVPVGTGVRAALEALGLMGKYSHDKFVPDCFKLAPIKVRWELVRGLFDTDGTADRGGHVSFTSTSLRLTEDVRWLVQSLGFRATRSERVPTYRDRDGARAEGRLAYTLYVQGPDPWRLFHLSRKRARASAEFNGGASVPARRMVAIESAGKAESRCITVDHPNGLYLTNDCIVTHNSTLVGVLAREFERRGLTVAYAALTGRASSILGRKLAAAGAAVTGKIRPDAKQKAAGAGEQLELFDPELHLKGGPAFCGTLHRLLYRAVINEREELLGWRKRIALDRKYDLLVVDEASMISREVLEDLTVHGVPVLAVGDHGQLPPVGSSGSVVDDPELRLEKIHRQAADNPIIALSDVVRRTGVLRSKLADGKQVFFDRRTRVGDYLRDRKTQRRAVFLGGGLSRGIVCHRNATRVWLNGLAREAAGFEGEPRKNEVLICLRNAPPIFNGMRGLLASNSAVDNDEPWVLNARVGFPEEGLGPEDYRLFAPQFNRPEGFRELEELHALGVKANTMSEAGLLFDFGYALTVHKAQGSEFDTCIVYLDRREDPTSEDWRRWIYTSVTRAKRRLVVLR